MHYMMAALHFLKVMSRDRGLSTFLHKKHLARRDLRRTDGQAETWKLNFVPTQQ